jgi:hypothetical protein
MREPLPVASIRPLCGSAKLPLLAIEELARLAIKAKSETARVAAIRRHNPKHFPTPPAYSWRGAL